jgi:anti-anti-sigma factor
MDDLDRGATASVKAGTDESGVQLISIAGELDVSNVDEVEQHLESLMGDGSAPVIFELSALTFMDSSGIAMLLRCAEKSEQLSIRNPSKTVKLVIDATGLAEVLRVES